MLASANVQRRIFRTVRQKVQRYAAGEERRCLYWAYFGLIELIKQGFQACLQAGSVSWLRVTREEYDAGCQTSHFSMVWSPEGALSKAAEAMGALPEMHVWLGLLGTRKRGPVEPADTELVDFSTGHLKQMCQETGMPWTAPDPPRFLWTRFENMPELVSYEPIREATMYADRTIKQLVDEGKVPDAKTLAGGGNMPYLQGRLPGGNSQKGSRRRRRRGR